MQDIKIPEPRAETVRLVRYLQEKGVNETSLLDAVDLIQQRTDVFLDDAVAVAGERQGFKSACAAGCGYCCHTLVTAMPPEVFYVARHLEQTLSKDELKEAKERVG